MDRAGDRGRRRGPRDLGDGPLSRRELSDYDEDDARVRATRRGSRPHTKRRPKHEDALEAIIIAVDRGRYTCLIAADSADEREVLAMRARELGRKSVVVGDRVGLVGDTSGADGSLARIVRIEDRTSTLRRSADDVDSFERVIVANAEELVIVCAAANPEPRTGFVDRAIVAAYAGGLQPTLLMTKTDLADPETFIAQYADLGVTILRRGQDEPVDEIADHLRGRTSVFFGHSGVGKSTLVNALVPDARRATGNVADLTGKGRHTSSSAVALRLPGGGIVIDTPGVRSLGLGHVEPETVVAAFDDLVEGAEHCPPNCEHLSADQGCRLDEWVADGNSTPHRLLRLRALLQSRLGQPDDSGPVEPPLGLAP